ncbi:uncharacterized membrane protein [[Candida] railenensis]|uniref:Uncharacterized membrane protein n=1 Tax=[Candida] railenensis TaxID=45579 RepID=A0A9P0QMZ6_9ASCO|nr:uncharacterized membrane protein [[Candida] railenensis]
MTPPNSSFRDQYRGFPIWQMTIICIIRFSEPIAFSSLFPYVYFMIRDFGIAEREEDISKYSGYLASCFAFCQFLFAMQWGKLGDRKFGRKPILLFGLFGTSISLILFGFSKNYYMAVAARSLAGALNGNVAVLRTMIGEIATERRHQGLAFSTLPLLFNFGSVIGPLIGGSKYLTRPKMDNPYHPEPKVENLGSFYNQFLDKYPYALSNIVVALFLWFSLLCGILFLEETHEKFKYRKDLGVELGDIFLKKLGITPPIRPWNKSIDPEGAGGDSTSGTDMESELLDENSRLLVSNDESDSNVSSVVSRASTEKDSSVAFTPAVITAITSNFIISLHSVTYNEFLPVFLASRFKPDKLEFPFKIEGGFGLTASYIGQLFSSTGIMGMLIVLTIFPIIDRYLGTINGFRLSVSMFPIVYFIVPLSIFTLHEYNPSFPTWVTPCVLYSLTSLKTLGSATGMPQIMLLNHRAAPKQHRAYVNGSTMSIIALARCTGPVVFGYLMSVGDKAGHGWLLWWVMALLALVGTFQSYMMKDYED